MKIAIVRTFLSNKVGGTEISANLLSEKLSSSGHEVITIAAKKDHVLSTPIRTYDIPSLRMMPSIVLMFGSGPTDFLIKRGIRRILEKEKPDLIHIQDFSILPAAADAAKRSGIPTILTVRDYRFECNLAICLEGGELKHDCTMSTYLSCAKKTFKAKYGWSSLSYIFFPLLYSRRKKMRRAVSDVSSFITVSDFMKEKLALRGVDKDKMKTIYNLAPDWKGERSKRSEKITLFSAGLFSESKGFSVLIDAFAIAKRKRKDLALRIAGSGPLEANLKAQAQRLGLKDSVQFLGRLPFPKMKDEYFNSDAVIMPSIWPEPMGRTILEAFAAKKPVIATKNGGSAELVRDGKTGLLVPIKDAEGLAKAILKIASDKSLRNALGSNGKAFNKKINTLFIKEHLMQYENAD